ncbi:TIR domain-containing protein [Mariniradius sediminis]|nr:nucleotide-binding protein [Mariniradius sediminis]
MSKRGIFEQWVEFVGSATQKRTFHAVGFDHEIDDSLTALADMFNQIQNSQIWEELISFIISEFIKSLEFRINLQHLKESLSLTGFSENSLSLIYREIEMNSEKDEKRTLNKKNVSSNNLEKLAERSKSKVFIVHGHEEGLKQSVARYLEKHGIKPVIISEQPSGSNTIIEQIEEYGDVDFAVVLMTGDDEGRKKGDRKFNSRARQNVILELGYFLGRLGRKHVAVIYENDVEKPSDFSGILYIPYDLHGAWKVKLVKELKSSGFRLDMNLGL